MSKYLLVTLVLLVAVALWRHKHRKAVAPKPRPGAAPRNHLPVQTMVCCAHCGLHLPQAEASAAQGSFFAALPTSSAVPVSHDGPGHPSAKHHHLAPGHGPAFMAGL